MPEETTAEYEISDLLSIAELKTRVAITVACKTDLGRVRENNEDKFEYYLPEDEATLAARGLVFVVCDGMGGHAAGQIASELACKTFIDVYLHHPAAEADVALRAGVTAANRFVTDVSRAIPARRGMGTTLSGLILLQSNIFTVQVGDSRIYRLRDGELVQLTIDHTWVEEMTRGGFMSRQEAENHPRKHMLTRAIGVEGDIQPDIELHVLQQGDIYMLCSDGLINHVSDETIGQLLSSHAPSEAVWKLVGAALTNGGSDNTTVMVVRVDEMISV
ncbi:MAG TPA: Stp1/IreP family PP2C-type Ser/Thr phosphatase [Fimbriimonadaceae bacterium]|jgi:protein phosphatase